jgi:glutaminase
MRSIARLRSLLFLLPLAGACGGGTTPAGASSAEVVSSEMAAAAAPAQPPPPPAPQRAAAGDPYRDSLARAYTEFKDLSEGKNADYIPALAKVDSKLFGIALATVDGAVYEVGNVRDEFSIQSVSKVFTLARAIDALGPGNVEDRIGVDATGMPFNSIIAVEMNKEKHAAGNPLVNPGAIAMVAALPAEDVKQKWNILIGTYSAFAARPLGVNAEVYRSESETNTRNRAIATLLEAYEVIEGNSSEALDLYTRQCSVNVSARDLAVMGATLANGGRNPLTRQQVVKPETVERVLAVMATAGLYETTGTWLYDVGVPAKSGVGGGIVAVVPGRFAIGTFAPPLDEAGNSVRGQRAISSIIDALGANVFASQPRQPAAGQRSLTGAVR